MEDHPDDESVWRSGQLEPLLLNRSYRLIFSTHPAKLSITHNSGGSQFRAEFDIGESCEAAPDDDDAGRRIARARKVAPKAGKFDDVECQRSDFASSIAGVGDEAIENPDLTPGQSDVRRLV
jgi:hypothetical protein